MAAAQGTTGKAPVLKSAADAVALSAATGEAFQVTKQLTQLKEVLLAEHPDASNAARERCLRLRSGLATALRAALVQHPTGRRLLEGPSPPKVRIEVRHTAGRMLSEEVFTVGRAAECDVQTTGDPTCSRLQLLVISLPGGLCIADAWSNSGTRVVRREAQETLEASVPQHRKAFLLPHGERVTLMTGAKTTVSFGPAVKDLNLPRGSSEAARVDTVNLVEEQAPKIAVPAPASPGEICSRAISSQRGTIRAQQQSALRERLKGRFQGALRHGLVPMQQERIFQERLASAEAGCREDLRDYLDGLGVIQAPDEPSLSIWTCGACKAQQKCRGFRCPFQHRCCRECYLQADAKCPVEVCSYVLGLADMQDLRFPEDRWTKALGGDIVEPLHCALRCGAKVSSKERRRWACSCGAAPVCTACGATPFHHHGKCSEVPSLRARWSSWLAGGREAYATLQKRLTRTAKTQNRVLREALEIGSQAGESVPEPKAKAKAKAKARGAVGLKSWMLAGTGVRHLLTACALCGKNIVGPRFRCIHCADYSACQKCEEKLVKEHPEGHVFQIMFEDELDWEKADVQLPKNSRARLRFHAMQVPVEQSGGRKRSLSSEGVLRSFKRGKYDFELSDGSGHMEVAPKDIQPLLTLKQAERLSTAGIFASE